MDLRICHAVAEKRLLMFTYRGSERVVEPHTYGRTTKHNDALSAWLREGWSQSAPAGGWRMFLVDEISALSILPERFTEARPRYNPNDPIFEEIFCRAAFEASA
jgi:hypothetical protein